MTIVYGGLLGVFICAAFLPRRGSGKSALAGLVTGAVIGFGLFLQKPILALFHVDEAVIAWPWWIVITSLISLGICASATGSRERKAPR